MNRRSATLLLAISAVEVLAAAEARGQTYPARPIRLVVGFSAGGPTDVIARVVAQDMSAALGQPVVVENRTGANALIATEAVAREAPDGHTLMVSTLSHSVNAVLVPQARYDPLRDFAPVGLVAMLPLIAVTGPNTPFASPRALVAAAKARPGEVTYGSAGNGGSAHLAAALLANLSGAEMTHVPFRGNGPALSEVMAGRVSFMFYPMIGSRTTSRKASSARWRSRRRSATRTSPRCRPWPRRASPASSSTPRASASWRRRGRPSRSSGA
jgi:tripartite-type tricarboxylate transporter receptor subunit TctC